MAQVNYDAATGESYVVQQRPAWDGSKVKTLQDYYEDEYGQTHHVFENTVLDEDAQEVVDDYDQWLVDTYQELYGGPEAYQQMMDFAQDNWEQVDIDRFNEIVDGNDIQQLEDALAMLNEQYQASLQAPPTEQQPEELPEDEGDVEQWFENLPEETLDGAVDELMEADYSLEDSEKMESLQTQFEDSSAEYAVLDLGQQITNGQVEMADAIEMMIDRFGEAEAARAYFSLQQPIQTILLI